VFNIGKVRTLVEIINNLESYGDEETIFAKEPWTPDSPAIVLTMPESPGLPEEANQLEMSYFIEPFIAQEFLEGWVKTQDTTPTLREQCERLIQYAIHDA
jgi:hypothetical protein